MHTVAIAILTGLLVAAATVAIGVGLAGTQPTPAARDVDWRHLARRGRTVAAVTFAGALGWAATGWPVASLLTTGAVWLVPHTLKVAARQRRDRQQLEATRMWLLQLRTTLRAGVGLESALRETARQSGPDSPLAGPLARLADRLDWMPTGQALDLLAAELDNHVADTAIVVLRSALTHSHHGIAATLHTLGDWADEDLRQLRQVDAETRGLRLAKRSVLAVWAAMAIYLPASSPDLMAPYRTIEGQAVLGLLAGLAGLALWLLTMWSRPQRPQRFFQPDPKETAR